MNINNLVPDFNSILKNLNILYIEDEENIRKNITKTLEIFCNNIFEASNIKSADFILNNSHVDIIISDITLKEGNGLEFIKKVRLTNKTIPVIFITAYTDTSYLLQASKLKLIDYLTKPINFKTLKSALNNSVQDIIDNSKYIINFPNNIKYNVMKKKLFDSKKNYEIHLTSKELLLLEYLIKFKNRIISQDELKINIWEDSINTSDSALKSLMNKIRKKIGKENIINISGIGYRIKIN